MPEINLEELKEKINKLGILNIEAFNDVDAVCIADTVQAVETLDRSLDIDSLLECNNKKLKAVTK